MTPEQVLARFMDCLAYASKPLPGERVEQVLAMLARIASLDDVRALGRLLVV